MFLRMPDVSEIRCQDRCGLIMTMPLADANATSCLELPVQGMRYRVPVLSPENRLSDPACR